MKLAAHSTKPVATNAYCDGTMIYNYLVVLIYHNYFVKFEF
jgi:hypothetical protein